MSVNPQTGQPYTELELLRMKMNKTTDESLESTRRMVQMCDESQKVGAATMQELNAQGEQLRGVDSQMDNIHADLNEADKNLDDLEKCCGLCIPAWKKTKKAKTNGAFKNKPLGVEVNQPSGRVANAPQSYPATAGQKNAGFGPGGERYITRITNDAREDEMEQNLQQVAGMVGELHGMATDMNQEIRTHNEILDRIDRKTDANQAQLNVAQKRADRIVGQPSKESDGMGSKAKAGLAAAQLMMH
ncbi:unnamed protein product [Calicophoron daubneyi]|uniref:t-SNARE coiled-coil homology domain-containing protein n=1 Tax=Calicophoron daubneyi TaxID=300641 RepID=A0AAV2TXT1_CALDB